jgi:hypothetical protein
MMASGTIMSIVVLCGCLPAEDAEDAEAVATGGEEVRLACQRQRVDGAATRTTCSAIPARNRYPDGAHQATVRGPLHGTVKASTPLRRRLGGRARVPFALDGGFRVEDADSLTCAAAPPALRQRRGIH